VPVSITTGGAIANRGVSRLEEAVQPDENPGRRSQGKRQSAGLHPVRLAKEYSHAGSIEGTSTLSLWYQQSLEPVPAGVLAGVARDGGYGWHDPETACSGVGFSEWGTLL